MTYRAQSGLLLHAHKDHGLPFLRARVILIYLATRASREGESFAGSLADINRWFDIDWPMDNLQEHFLRVVHTEVSCPEGGCLCAPEPCYGRTPVAHAIAYNSDDHRFRVTLSRGFMRMVHRGNHTPAAPILRLVQLDQLAALDLFTFYMWRWQSAQCAKMESFGDTGPFVYIKSATARYRKRHELFRMHQRVVEVWPDCPYHVSTDGNRILCHPDKRQRVKKVCKRTPTGRGRKPSMQRTVGGRRQLRPRRVRHRQPSGDFHARPLRLDEYRPDRRVKPVILYTDAEIAAWVARNQANGDEHPT